MKAKTPIRIALCFLGMLAAPYFMTRPAFMDWVSTDVLGAGVGNSELLSGYTTLGALLVGFGSYFALLVRAVLKKWQPVWVVLTGLIYLPLLFFYLVSPLIPPFLRSLIPDL